MEKFLTLSEEKQTTIRNAALACFAKHGYEKASVNDIAMAAGVSKASIFQYFGTKQALYEYLVEYCSEQMKQAYNQSCLEENADFFDRVWQASIMKVENLKKNPYVAAFITQAVVEKAPEMKDTLQSLMNDGEMFTQALVVHEEDTKKFKHPEDVDLLFKTLMLMAQGMAAKLERGADYDTLMEEFEAILKMLRCNFYKEEYLA